MDVGPWNECVLVAARPDGGVEFVSTAKQAAAMLCDKWPAKRGPAFQEAVAACNEVMQSYAPSYLARVAFESAVKEAGLWLYSAATKSLR
jgi:hypothetical protein